MTDFGLLDSGNRYLSDYNRHFQVKGRTSSHRKRAVFWRHVDVNVSVTSSMGEYTFFIERTVNQL